MHFSFYNKPFITLIVKKTCQLLLRISVNGPIVLKMVGFVFHQGEAAAAGLVCLAVLAGAINIKLVFEAGATAGDKLAREGVAFIAVAAAGDMDLGLPIGSFGTDNCLIG